MSVMGFFALWMSGGCAVDTGVRNLFPSLAVVPGELAFGEVGPPLTSTIPLYVSNAGSADLELTSVTLAGPDVFAFTPPDGAVETEPGVWAFTVGPEAQVELPVTFTPDSFRTWTGDLVLHSNDEEHERVVIPVSGEGVDLPFGDIDISPSRTITIDEVTVGSSAIASFDVRNTGDAPLSITAIVMEGSAAFTPLSLPEGAVIQPGELRTAVLSYAPAAEGGDNALLFIDSDDPDEPTTTVLLLGNGGGKDFEYPVAVIDCPTDVLLAGPEFVHLDGSGSYDPAGFEPLTYAWKVVQHPVASDEDLLLDPDDTPSIDLYADVAGDWAVQLVVTNTLGTASEPAVCAFPAVPEDAIHVELSWDTSQADLDLHLVQGGSQLFDTPEDCNYCNPNPDWGANGPDDDPRLDIDDLGGFGPENINLFAPEDGTYEVKVHYFSPHGDEAVVATVRVWLYGALVFDGSRVVEVAGAARDVWEVGTIDMPSGLLFADLGANTPTTEAACQN